jgi:zinc/manganese transport system substrate-binding protein
MMLKHSRWLPILGLALATSVTPSRALAAISVVTSTEDLASIAKEVGGDKVKVEAIARGYQDPHFVEPKPSFILPPLIQQSRNARIQPGADGYLDASLTVRILELPTGQITRAMGDVHPQGNPHYWLDPENGRKIAQAVQAKLSAISRSDAAYFAQRYADFDRRLGEALKKWTAAMAPYKGLKVVTYHRSWANFADRFGVDVIGYVEPKPGIPPTPSHTLDVIQEMKRQNVKLILVEPYFDLKTPQSIARATGAEVLVLPPSVGGVKEVTDYIGLFDYDVNTLVAAIKRAGAK